MLSGKQSADDDLIRLQAKVDELEAELSRRQLRARVDELEAELTHSDRGAHQGRRAGQQTRRGATTTKVSDTNGNVSERIAKESLKSSYEIKRVGRGLVLVSLDQVGLIADFFSNFANEVLTRNQPTPDTRPGELFTSLPGDVLHSFSAALKQTIHNSRNPINTFQEKYQEVRPLRQSAELRVVSAIPADNSSGLAPSTVSVTFSSNIQPAERDFKSSLVVKKEDKTVPGAIKLSNQNTLVWTPEHPLDAGTYIVRVTNVESYARHNIVRMRDPFIFVFIVKAAGA
jgi:hypothetical protein